MRLGGPDAGTLVGLATLFVATPHQSGNLLFGKLLFTKVLSLSGASERRSKFSLCEALFLVRVLREIDSAI